jgi:HlyD family secretion protein
LVFGFTFDVFFGLTLGFGLAFAFGFAPAFAFALRFGNSATAPQTVRRSARDARALRAAPGGRVPAGGGELTRELQHHRRVTLHNLARRPGLWIVLALAAGAAVVVALRLRGPLVTTSVATRRDIEQHLVASGRVRVPTRVQFAAQIGGLVVAVGVVEGQRVKAGDLLVQLDDGGERAAVAQAAAAVKQAAARVQQLKRVGAIVTTEQLREAESNLARAETELARTEKLAASGAVPIQELDNARTAVAVARAQRNAAEAQRLAATPVGADSRVALAALLQAEAVLAGAEVRLAQTRVVARQDGTVLARQVEPGDVVQPSRTLLVVAADAEVQLVFFPDERNLAGIRLGQVAAAAADAYPDDLFEAMVSYIAPSVDPQRGSVEVRLAVPQPPARLKPDMTVSIDLTIAAKANALVVDSDVVRDAATPRPFVLVVEDGRVARRDVRLGIRGEGASEVVDGIVDGAELIVPDGRRLEPGARVRRERE